MASPLVYAVRFRLFTQPLLAQEDAQEVWRVQWVAKGLFRLGILLLLVYALTRVWLVPRTGNLAELFSGLDRKTLLGFSADSSLFRPWD